MGHALQRPQRREEKAFFFSAATLLWVVGQCCISARAGKWASVLYQRAQGANANPTKKLLLCLMKDHDEARVFLEQGLLPANPGKPGGKPPKSMVTTCRHCPGSGE